jgi:hypothetical protein
MLRFSLWDDSRTELITSKEIKRKSYGSPELAASLLTLHRQRRTDLDPSILAPRAILLSSIHTALLRAGRSKQRSSIDLML